MPTNHQGAQSLRFKGPITITETAAIAGPKEGQGPLKSDFDRIHDDILAGADSWEKAESEYLKEAIGLVLTKTKKQADEIDFIFAGDLLNQCTGSSYGAISFNRPFFGIFGACSTFGEGLGLGSALIDGGFATSVIAAASSHFCSAEKQFRFPLELGTQRPPTASWTVTGCGAALLSEGGNGPYVTGMTVGKMVDLGIKDAGNMGAAMAPSAADSLMNHFNDFGRAPEYYDLIITGDLGFVGMSLLKDLLKREGVTLGNNYNDCGAMIFSPKTQDTHAGGSGCGCSAITFSGHIMKRLRAGEIKKVLLCPTGALFSPTSSQQGQSIPGICHCVAVETEREGN